MIPERARLNASRRGISRHGERSAWRKMTAPIPKHLAKARLLIRTNDSSRLEVDIKIGVHSIVAKIIFFQHGILEFVAALLHSLGKGKFNTARTLYMTDTDINLGVVNLKGMDVLIIFINFIWHSIRK
jgi:hypothetical protein